MAATRVDFDEFAKYHCSAHVNTPDGLAAVMRRQLRGKAVSGWILFETADLASSRAGTQSILPFGGGATLQSVPPGPVSFDGSAVMRNPRMFLLAEDLPCVYRVDTADGIRVDEAELPSGVRVRHGDELVLSATTQGGEVYENLHCRIARLFPDRMWVWPQNHEGGDVMETVGFRYHKIDSATVFKRHWEDPPPGSLAGPKTLSSHWDDSFVQQRN